MSVAAHPAVAHLRRGYRTVLLIGLLFYAWLLVLVTAGFWRPGNKTTRRAKRHWCRCALIVLGVRVSRNGTATPSPALWVSNHISWLDILVLSAEQPLVFLSKREVGNWPIVGTLARAVGTQFIDRGAGQTAQVNDQISQCLREGISVIIFPEGTTTDGTTCRRFYPQLFHAPLLSLSPVQPVTLRYGSAAGEPDTRVAFIDDMALQTHLWERLAVARTPVSLTYAPAISTSPELSRLELCQKSHSAVSMALQV